MLTYPVILKTLNRSINLVISKKSFIFLIILYFLILFAFLIRSNN